MLTPPTHRRSQQAFCIESAESRVYNMRPISGDIHYLVDPATSEGRATLRSLAHSIRADQRPDNPTLVRILPLDSSKEKYPSFILERQAHNNLLYVVTRGPAHGIVCYGDWDRRDLYSRDIRYKLHYHRYP